MTVPVSFGILLIVYCVAMVSHCCIKAPLPYPKTTEEIWIRDYYIPLRESGIFTERNMPVSSMWRTG